MHLHDHVAVDSLLNISAPAGRFTFTGERESIVLIAGGIGITPMMSVIRYLTDISFPGDIFLLFGARTTEDFVFREELEYLQRRHPNVHIAATMSRAGGTAWMGPEGPISKEFIAQAVPEIAGRHVHTPNRGIAAASCLTCHGTDAPVLAKQSTAFHAAVQECRGCHIEHREAAMRPTEMDHTILARIGWQRAADGPSVASAKTETIAMSEIRHFLANVG